MATRFSGLIALQIPRDEEEDQPTSRFSGLIAPQRAPAAPQPTTPPASRISPQRTGSRFSGLITGASGTIPPPRPTASTGGSRFSGLIQPQTAIPTPGVESPVEEGEGISTRRQIVAEAVRAGFGTIGALLGPIGAGVATFPGEAIAQPIAGKGFSPARFMSEFVLNVASSLIPGSRAAIGAAKASRLARIGRTAAQGAGIGLASSGLTQLAEKGRIDLKELVLAGGASGLFGTAIGAAGTRGRGVIDVKATEEITGRKASQAVGEGLAALGGKKQPKVSAAELEALESTQTLEDIVSRVAEGRQVAASELPEFTLRAAAPVFRRVADALVTDPEALQRVGLLEELTNERLFGSVIRVAKDKGLLDETAGSLMAASHAAYEATISAGAMSSAQLSRIRQAMDKVTGDLIEKHAGKNALKSEGIASQLANMRRAFMVSQMRTQIRNAIFNTGRFFIDAMDNSMRELLLSEGIEAGQETLAQGFRQLNARQIGAGAAQIASGAVKGTKEAGATGFRQINTALQATFSKSFRQEMDKTIQAAGQRNPAAFRRFATSRGLASVVGFETTGHKTPIDKASEFAQLLGNAGFGQKSELFTRRITAHANLANIAARRQRQNPKLANLTVQEMIEGGHMTKADIGDALERGLEVTMAGRPIDSRVAQAFVNMVEGSPGKVLTLMLPFPQFMARRMQFFTDFNPAGPLKLFLRDPKNPTRTLLGDPEAVAKQISRATIGTFGLAAGFEVLDRYGVEGGPWFRVALDHAPQTVKDALEADAIDTPGGLQTDIDVFDPLSAYLGLAAAIRDVNTTGTINMEGEELARLMISVGRLDSTGQLAAGIIEADMFTDETGQVRFRDLLTRAIGDYFSVATAPAKTALDIMTALGAVERAKMRDVREAPVVGPLLRQSGRLGEIAAETFGIPFPEQPRSTTGSSERREVEGGEILEQLLGVRVFHGDIVEQELRKAGIDPFREVGAKPQVSTNLGFGERVAGERVKRQIQRGAGEVIGENLKKKLVQIQPRLERAGDDRDVARAIIKDAIGDLRGPATRRAELQLTPEERRIRRLTSPESGAADIQRGKRRREAAVERGDVQFPERFSRETLGFGAR